MHKFLRAIGFRECYSKRQQDELIKDVMKIYDNKKVINHTAETKIVELNKEYADGIGICVVGEVDLRGFFRYLYSYPYCNGTNITTEESIQMQKFAEKEAYAEISEDSNIGVSLIFYVQNLVDYLGEIQKNPARIFQKVFLSGLSIEGKILFDIEKTDEQQKQEIEGKVNRSNLIQAAKAGDVEAIESLTLEDIDLYSLISRRILSEDVYSIVDTSFMPYGVESDQYSILGKIISVDELTNSLSKDKVYMLEVECNDLMFHISINKEDLYGEPKVGRRFKGNIWLQGSLI